MKKYILFYLLLLGIVVSIGLLSCSSDDDGGGGNASTSAGVLDKKSGLRLKSFGDYIIYYDEKGRIDNVRDSYGRWDFSYSPNKITFFETYNGKSSEKEVFTVSYNGSGYLSGMEYSESEQNDDGDRWTASERATLSYDGSGHLTKLSVSGKESGVDGGERYSETWTYVRTLTWRNGKLLQVVIKEEEVEDGEKETQDETWTFEYDNDSYANVYRQWTPTVAGFIDDDLPEVLACVGLFGVGPDMLPSSASLFEEEYYDGRHYQYEESYSYRYGFNSDGSVAYAYVDSSRYNFSYSYADTRSAVVETPWQPTTASGKQGNRRFGWRHRAHRVK